MDNNKKIYSIGDLILEIGKLIKSYEENINVREELNNADKMFDINEVISIYPQLSKHLITKYINEGLIPVTRIGNHRYFYKNDIDNFLKSKEELKDKKKNYNSWRNVE